MPFPTFPNGGVQRLSGFLFRFAEDPLVKKVPLKNLVKIGLLLKGDRDQVLVLDELQQPHPTD